MIDIKDKDQCCGCEACVQACPQQCISMSEDSEGFLYPKVDTKRCVGCILCEKVCPVIYQALPAKPLTVKAAKNPDEESRLASSSGGVFSVLAENIIRGGGVVFGARFDEKWKVVHDCTETLEGLKAFRGSKYMQSRTGKSFRKTEYFLKQGRMVLFSGTACQIAGLKRFLRKEYDNLLTVDVVCHGVPSPKVWTAYLEENSDEKQHGMVSSVDFRNKRHGWKNYGLHIGFRDGKSVYEPFRDNLFMKGFLADLYLRPSCYHCPAKGGKSGSDITLGDFWGVRNYYPELDDDKGLSAVLLNSEKGRMMFGGVVTENKDVTYESVLAGNPSIGRSVDVPEYRSLFWQMFERNGMNAVRIVCKKTEPGLLVRNLRKLKRVLVSVIKRVL